MSSKKKLVISLSVAAAVLVAAIIAIVAVFAAAQQAVKSDITIKFKATDVACEINGTWTLPKVGDYEAKTGTFGPVAFAAAETQAEEGAEKTLSVAPEVNLTSSQNYIEFTYTFTNAASTGILIKMSEIKLVYADSNEEVQNVTISYKKQGMDDAAAVETTGAELLGTGVICEGGVNNTATITIGFTIEELAFELDRTFTANFGFDLTAQVNE